MKEPYLPAIEQTDMERVAALHRYMQRALLVYVGFWAVVGVFVLADVASSPLMDLILPVVLISIILVALVIVCKLMNALRLDMGVQVLVILGCASGLAILAIPYVDRKASKTLRAAGYKVGLMGARRDQVA